jgi:hypothetical protein
MRFSATHAFDFSLLVLFAAFALLFTVDDTIFKVFGVFDISKACFWIDYLDLPIAIPENHSKIRLKPVRFYRSQEETTPHKNADMLLLCMRE